MSQPTTTPGPIDLSVSDREIRRAVARIQRVYRSSGDEVPDEATIRAGLKLYLSRVLAEITEDIVYFAFGPRPIGDFSGAIDDAASAELTT